MTDNEIRNETPTGPQPGRGTLRRDETSRMVAGVCGGLGRHLGVDPVVFRVLFAVLTFFGGFGLLVYAAAWLLVPSESQTESEAQKLLSGRSTAAAIMIAVVLVLGFLAMTRTLADGFGSAVPLLAVAAAVVAVVAWRNEGGAARHGGGGTAPFQPTNDPNAPAGGPQPWWQRPAPAYPTPPAGQAYPNAEFGTMPLAEPAEGIRESAQTGERKAHEGAQASSDTKEADPASTMPEDAYARLLPPSYATTGPGAFSAPFPGPVAAPATRETPQPPPSRLSAAAFSVVLVVLGTAGVLGAAGAFHGGWTTGFGLAILAIGVIMAVSGAFGRARWLAAVALVLAVPLIVANALGVPLRGETGDITWSPTTVAAADAPYQLAAGRGVVDLRGVNPAGGTVDVVAHVGLGRLIVEVPDSVALEVDAHVGFGRLLLPDGSDTGAVDVTRSISMAASGTPQGTIVLDLKVGAGSLEVDRVAG